MIGRLDQEVQVEQGDQWHLGSCTLLYPIVFLNRFDFCFGFPGQSKVIRLVPPLS